MSWKTCTVLLLYKKGDPNDVGKYRSISLLSTLYKIFTSVLLSRIIKCMKKTNPESKLASEKAILTWTMYSL